jgi:5-methylcytosine-specific restriction endonuclease McrA
MHTESELTKKERKRAKRAAYWAANKERFAASRAIIYAANRDNIRAKRAVYYAKNKERIRAKRAAHYAKNKGKYAALFAAYYAKNKEKAAAWHSAYVKTHHGRSISNAIQARRRARELKAECIASEREEIKFLYALSRSLGCGGVKHHVDHIIPLSKGGSHKTENLRVVPAVVNLRKRAKLIA